MTEKIMNLVFDIDDTIYHNQNEKLTEDIYNAIRELNSVGYTIYFATRREAFNLKVVQNYIDNNIVTDIICANGLYSINEEEKQGISKTLLENLTRDYSLLAVANNGFYTNDQIEFEGFVKFLYTDNEKYISELENISSINLRSNIKSEYIESLANENIDVSYDDLYNTYELNVSSINKFNKVEEILNGKKFIGFGDNPKDDECLFKYEGILLRNDKRHNLEHAISGEQLLEYLTRLARK